MRMAQQIPVGTAYAVCIGALGVAVLGMVLFGERASPARLTCIGLIVAGGIGLKPASWFPLCVWGCGRPSYSARTRSVGSGCGRFAFRMRRR